MPTLRRKSIRSGYVAGLLEARRLSTSNRSIRAHIALLAQVSASAFARSPSTFSESFAHSSILSSASHSGNQSQQLRFSIFSDFMASKISCGSTGVSSIALIVQAEFVGRDLLECEILRFCLIPLGLFFRFEAFYLHAACLLFAYFFLLAVFDAPANCLF
jgi:hypothetical protein